MKLVQINTTCGSGSTGKICVAISRLLTERGIENYILYASGDSDYPLGRKYMKSLDGKLQALRSRVFGNFGFNSETATRKLISMLEEIQPDIVHLHNLHGHNCNLQILFTYLKKKKIKVFWTFHDCWAFTGYCPHYDMAGCEKWKTGCGECPLRSHYSWLFDRSKHNFDKKKELFTDVDLTIITPSHWLAEQVQQSFLHNKEIKVIHNGIDLSVFKPTESDFRTRYGCCEKYIILGVSYIWVYQKGLDVFIELSKRLDDRFQIVMVGTNDEIDKQLPPSIISIHRTNNETEMAEIYSAADVFVNPTRQEVLGLTNLEALACGTPVVTFNTGGSPECIDETCGTVVPKDDVNALIDEINEIRERRELKTGRKFEYVNKFNADEIYDEYINLYC